MIARMVRPSREDHATQPVRSRVRDLKRAVRVSRSHLRRADGGWLQPQRGPQKVDSYDEFREFSSGDTKLAKVTQVMDPVRNPFVPGAGNPPPELAGRSLLLDQAKIALQRVAQQRHSQSLILVGLRGVGKTVLLNRMKDMAETLGYRAHLLEAHEGKPFPELLVPALRSALMSISTVESARSYARRAMRVLASFVRALKVTVNDVEYGIDLEAGTADSGDIEADLPDLLQAVGEAAKAAQRPVAILIDEMQYMTEKEFSAIIMAVHRASQQALPVLMIGAGLPQIIGLAGESKSYAERLFRFPRIGALTHDDAQQAIVNPLRTEGVHIEPAALQLILSHTERYPYFLQQWGHDSWNVAQNEIITQDDVVRAYSVAIKTLDESFFRVRFDRCSPAEKRYMRALAELGAGTHRSGDIAEVLGLKTTSVAPTRANLIRKGMIFSPSHGDTEFTVPLFDAYMRRELPYFFDDEERD